MEAKLYGQNKSGLSINGIIKNYYAYAGENIKAGDLVEFINGVAGEVDYGESVATQLSTETNSGYAISAVQLDDNKVFIAHNYGSSYYLYGMVCIINGATIIQGTDTAIASIKEAGTAISTCLLPNGSIFIAHSDNSAASIRLNGVVVTISGTTITTGSDTILVNSTRAGYTISTYLLPNGNVFIAHSLGDNYYLYGLVVSISGTTITAGADIVLNSTKYTGQIISTCLLPNGNVFIAHSYGSSYYLYGIVCSISGTTVGKGNDTVITDSSNVGRAISACTLENGNVFIAHSYGSNHYLYGIVCSINETTITKGTDTALEAGGYEAEKVLTMVLKENKVFVTKCHLADASRLWASICTINNTSITIGTTVRLSDARGSGNVMSSILLNNGTIFIAHNHTDGTNYLYAQIFDIDETNNIPTKHIIAIEYETQIRKVTTGQFDGVAKTSGNGGDEFAHKDLVSIYQSAYSFNIIPDGSFEGDIWAARNDASGIQITDKVSYSGNRSLYFPIGQTIVPEIPIDRPILGHKYYGRRYIKTNGDNQPADCRFEMYGGDGEGKNWVFAWNNGNHPKWDFDSAIHEITAINYPETTQTIVRCFNVNTTADTWVDNLLLLDLTDLFGAGKEPTKEWCDNNL
jgi:hypothetical protein